MIKNIILVISLLFNLLLLGALGLFVYQDEFLAHESLVNQRAIKEKGLKPWDAEPSPREVSHER
jgi:hypothetical protein